MSQVTWKSEASEYVCYFSFFLFPIVDGGDWKYERSWESELRGLPAAAEIVDGQVFFVYYVTCSGTALQLVKCQELAP